MTLLNEIKSEFPDIQEADIVRVLLFLGFTAEDINSPKTVQQIKFAEVVFPASAAWNEAKIAEITKNNQVEQVKRFQAEMNSLLHKTFGVF